MGTEVPRLQLVFDEVERAVFQDAGRVLDKMDKPCKATAVLRLAVFGTQIARSILALYDAGFSSSLEGLRRTLFETWTLMFFLLDVDDGSKLQKWFDVPAKPLLERSDRIRSKVEEFISRKGSPFGGFKEYYDGASSFGIHPTYDATTNAIAEATVRLGYGRESEDALQDQRTVAFRDLEFHAYWLLSLVVAVFDKSPELKPLKISLPQTRSWIKAWNSTRKSYR